MKIDTAKKSTPKISITVLNVKKYVIGHHYLQTKLESHDFCCCGLFCLLPVQDLDEHQSSTNVLYFPTT